MKKPFWKKFKLIFAFTVVILLTYYYLFDSHGLFTLHKMQNREDSLLVLRDSLRIEYQTLINRIEFLKNNQAETITEEARNWDLAFPQENEIIIHIDSTDLSP